MKKDFSILDINTGCLADYYLVLTGDKIVAGSSKNTIAPWVIKNVYIFNSVALIYQRSERKKIGVATSVAKKFWEDTEVYPKDNNVEFKLSDEQITLLGFFS